MDARRIVVAGVAAAVILGVGLDARAMGSATHDLARDMATRVYRTDYTGPSVSPCGPDHKEDAKPCAQTAPAPSGPDRSTACRSTGDGTRTACRAEDRDK